MEADDLTIEQLAARTGMTVRNIRAHQSRGLLPPPEVRGGARGRTGYYKQDHVARLQLIADMQSHGFNLKSIKRLLDSLPAGKGESVLQLQNALLAPWQEEEPEVAEAAELAARVGGASARAVQRAERLGVIKPLGDGKYEVPSPALMRVGERVAALGVPLDMLLSVVEQMDRSNEGVARAFTRLFHECIWKPFEEAGHPEEQWPQVIRAIEELRPLATEALLASFRMKMTEESEKAFEAALAREARRGSRHHRGDRERTTSRLPAPEPQPQT